MFINDPDADERAIAKRREQERAVAKRRAIARLAEYLERDWYYHYDGDPFEVAAQLIAMNPMSGEQSGVGEILNDHFTDGLIRAARKYVTSNDDPEVAP